MRAVALLLLPWSLEAFLTSTLRKNHIVIYVFGQESGGIPKSNSERDQQAIKAVERAIQRPKTPNYPLIECEFPPLQALNKLGDGSSGSARAVDDANIDFSVKLANGLSGWVPFNTRSVCLLTSSSSSNEMVTKIRKKGKSCQHHSLRNGVPESPADVNIVVAPSSRQDYISASQMAESGSVVILVNAFAKDPKSVSEKATFAYHQKPLTYNSQVVGYLMRSYPGDWQVIDVATRKALKSFSDTDILVRKTNTPDLRESGKLIQRAVDERAIQMRNKSNT